MLITDTFRNKEVSLFVYSDFICIVAPAPRPASSASPSAGVQTGMYVHCSDTFYTIDIHFNQLYILGCSIWFSYHITKYALHSTILYSCAPNMYIYTTSIFQP